MKIIKTTLTALLLTAVILPLVSCKKESTTPTPRSAGDKIAGKWKLESSVFDNFYSGASHIINYTGTAADYADFRKDGIVYSFVGGNYDTSAYAIISDTKMWIDASTEIFDIQTLNDTILKLYRKETYAPGEYSESTVNFKR